MTRRHWLAGIFCASLGLSIGCEGHFETTDVTDSTPPSIQSGSPSLRAPRSGIWGRRLPGTGGQSGGSSGTAGAVTGGSTGGQSGTTSGTGGAATAGATGGLSGTTSGTGGAATVGATGGLSGTTSGTGGAAATATGGSTASAGTCGNGKLDSGEFCDGSDLQSATCASLGFTGGSLACSSTCQLNASSCTGGMITPVVTASRTSCAAPCLVFFNTESTTGLASLGTTPNDVVAANWNWDWNDPTSKHQGAIGFVQAHVFDNPGSYNVTTRVRDGAGNAGRTTTTITVSAMSGTTYYVASTGNDSNNGTSTSTPFLTIAHALAVGLGTNKSVLLRNGDKFALGSSDTNISVTGPWRLAGYSDPAAPSSAAPILTSTDTGAFASIFILTGTDIRIDDLKISGNVLTAGGNLFADQGNNNLIERIESNVTGSTGVNLVGVDGTVSQAGWFDCNFHDFSGYGLFAGSGTTNLAAVGNIINNFTGMDHGIRVQGGSVSFGTLATSTNTVLDGNVITPAAAFDAIAVRGDNKYTVVVNNTANGYSINATPQNASGGGSDEHVQHVLIEGNTVSQTNPFRIVANHVVARNNVTVGADVAYDVENNSCSSACLPANWVDQVFIFNNTAYSPTTPGYFTNFIVHRNTTGNVTYRNNIFQTGSTSSQSSMLYTDARGTETFDHNLAFDPTVSLPSSNTGTSSVNNSNPMFVTPGSNFKLQSGSPARNAGTSVPVYQDPTGVTRQPVWDLGSYEYKP